MKVLIAPDKFKGSLTAQQVCDVVASTIKEKQLDWAIEKFPMADGGEGTCEILTNISGGKKVKAKARDPLFREIETWYGLSPDGQTAFIEMASASGLQLLKPEERNPLFTSSIGTGDLIAHALKQGVTSIILGCGGSATNDAGIGMATALGFTFLDLNGQPVLPIGDNLSKIISINFSDTMTEIQTCKFLVIADVDNPLFGPNGAAFTFALQKGASHPEIEQLDKGMKHFSKILEMTFGPGIIDFAGAGAAGGFPACARTFLNAKMKPGIDFIIDFAGVEEKVEQADLVITGEGKFDQQSLHGKAVSGMVRLCKKFNKCLWVVCGVSEVSEIQAKQLGIEKVLSIAPDESAIKEAMENAAQWIRKELLKAL